LVREIGWTLVFKVAMLVLLFAFFFSPADRVSVDDRGMEEALTAPAASSREN
jgi:hypothetical protein